MKVEKLKKKKIIKLLKRNCDDLTERLLQLDSDLNELVENPNSERSGIIKGKIRMKQLTEKAIWSGDLSLNRFNGIINQSAIRQ